MDPTLAKEINEHYKARQAAGSRDKSGEAISQSFTFDEEAPNLTTEECERFLRFVERMLLPEPLHGAGIEMGAGPGTWSAIIARSPRVEKVYALEACEPIAVLAEIVVPHVAPKDAKKVIPVVGEFDRLALPDASLDFAFDFFSLHHSTDIKKTFRELARVLKRGGIVLGFDKARPDYLSEAELEALVDLEYSRENNIAMGYPPDAHHTRRMNGENEYRLRDWREAFLAAGFSQFEHFNIARTASGSPLIKKGKEFFAHLPPRLQTSLTRFVISPSKRGGPLISSDHRVYSALGAHFPKEISVLIAVK
jgi:ubiquinone/menaquinone biosynthesis C-methylase UbiE